MRRAHEKNPSSIVYWNDLENDEKLKTCSWAARGLWSTKLLPMAARSGEPGVIVIGEHHCKWDDDLPTLLAIDAGGGTPDIVALVAETFRAMLKELVTSGAASVDERGRLYNRRMVREHQIRTARSAAGARGAASRWDKVPNGKPMANGVANGMANGVANPDADAAPQSIENTHENIPESQSALWQTDGNGHGKPMPSSHPSHPSQSVITENHTVGARADGAAPPKPDPKGTRLPEGWRPEGDLRQWTIDFIRDQQASVSAGHELERFRDHWKAQPGAKGRKTDWPATWRNWIRKAVDMEKRNGNRTDARPNGQSRNLTNAQRQAAFAAGLRGESDSGPTDDGGGA